MFQHIRNHELRIVLGVAFLFLIYALIHSAYGLPLHLIGDEESLLSGALKMLQQRTIPVLEPQEFSALYYPIGLPALYAIGTLSYAAFVFVFARGVDTAAQLSDYLLVHLEYPWLIARALSAFAGAALIVVTYRVARAIFTDQARSALYASLFVATSFLNFQLSVVARHWVFSALLLMLGLYYIVRNEKTDRCSLRRAGFLAGLSVGVSQIGVVTILLVACAYAVWNRTGLKPLLSNRSLREYAFISLPLAAFFFLLHPGAFSFIAAGEETPVAAAKDILFVLRELKMTIWYLLQHEFVITLLAVAGFFALSIARKARIAAILLLPIVLYNLFLVAVYHNAPRYHLYMIPLLSIAAGYALSLLAHGSARLDRRIGFGIAVVVFAVPLASALRYGYLLKTPPTESLASAWIRERAETGAAFVLNAPMLSFIHDDASAEFQSRVGRVPLVSRSLAGTDIGVFGGQKVRYVNVHFWDSESTRASLKEFIAGYRPSYAVISYDTEAAIEADHNRFLRSQGRLSAAFDNRAAGSPGIPVPVQPFDEYGFLNARLFSIQRFGSYVAAYQLN